MHGAEPGLRALSVAGWVPGGAGVCGGARSAESAGKEGLKGIAGPQANACRPGRRLGQSGHALQEWLKAGARHSRTGCWRAQHVRPYASQDVRPTCRLAPRFDCAQTPGAARCAPTPGRRPSQDAARRPRRRSAAPRHWRPEGRRELRKPTAQSSPGRTWRPEIEACGPIERPRRPEGLQLPRLRKYASGIGYGALTIR